MINLDRIGISPSGTGIGIRITGTGIIYNSDWYANMDMALHFVLQYVNKDILFSTSLFLLKLIGLLWTFHVSMGNLPHVSASIVLRNAVAHNLFHRDLCSISYDCPQQQKLKASCHVDSGQHGMTESPAEHFANPFI